MNRRAFLAVLVAAAASSSFALKPQLSAADQMRKVELQDGPQLTHYLQGDVLMLGVAFPGKYFQKAVLDKLKARKITVRLMTADKALKGLTPILKAGGEVRSMPAGMKGGLVITKNEVLTPYKGGWRVFSHANAVNTMTVRFEDIWRYGKPVKK